MKKAEDLLGLAMKAGALVLGYADTEEAAKKGQIKLIFISKDAAERTSRHAAALAEKERVILSERSGADFARALGRSGTISVIGVTDENFASGMIEKNKQKASSLEEKDSGNN